MVQAMTDRLTRDDWIRHGLSTLSGEGAHALKVGAMADALGVSRGSFYWHFPDIAEFRAELLRAWRERTTDRVIRDLEAGKGQPDRLKHLMTGAFESKRGLDEATRAWGAHDAAAAAAVAAVDARRIAYIARMLVASGVDRSRAQARATFMYWAYLGRSIVMDRRHASLPGPAIEEIADLFET
jgi:AcrR family transcriptional regulator